MDIPFLKKLEMPKFELNLGFGKKQASYIGIDIGASSAKVVQLRKEKERAVLESYGELKSAVYLKKADNTSRIGGGFLRYLESEIGEMLTDLIRESNITTNQAILSIPTVSAFIMLVDFPRISEDEAEQAIQFEAKKYIPIPLAEVSLDWEIIDEGEEKRVKVLLAAVPKEIISKYKRIAEVVKLNLISLEVENFALVRSLIGRDKATTAVINLGAQTTNVTITDLGIIRLSHNIDRGSSEVTRMLSRSLNIEPERADDFKKNIGLSDRPEEKEIADVIAPVVDSLFREILRVVNGYNRLAPRKVERVVLAGGGANLFGLVDYAAKVVGLETVRANPFSRVVYPAFMQPVLREIGPDFSVAVGLALRQITTR
ncbi:MAG: hypothetical protein A3A28_00910 [Candidatus Sungbacteria bacterium RIFCSPLOWO2_01_FULL_47_32]|uniref:SHS2 domain-containing protein n=1 Tax=Candidatus Sungbacteria bacterium RIFCSPHIGHO2_01_FULL_47_32 TaxID=1802264 RepID=A0A1G2K5U6_9BACT|nr:MAG: type IV pilus assembly protein PilM [Parcubacteria group bacterium GW2011_GWA2_47_10]OGZ93850.1 MAG: hypothetical protein A2633_04430 [Candidatus Sungbacteria bacterium RIFCSPHIGHO2_01_FULL_47_32]OHA04721.1 MAG: hypothetical protein A3A28_00910 [Candidatus Sungbacteria bacterium RIFCSPLOWO2_01_FULL_47_32]